MKARDGCGNAVQVQDAGDTERAEGTGGLPLLMSPGPGCAVTSSFTSLRQAPGALGERLRCPSITEPDRSCDVGHGGTDATFVARSGGRGAVRSEVKEEATAEGRRRGT